MCQVAFAEGIAPTLRLVFGRINFVSALHLLAAPSELDAAKHAAHFGDFPSASVTAQGL